MVPDLLSARQKFLSAVNGQLLGWDTPDTHSHDAGDSDLTLLSPGPRTTKLFPSYTYPSNYKPRIWCGTNDISYESRYDGREIGFTVFAQINDAATVKIFVYETSSDDAHDLNDENGSWYMEWTQNFPHNGSSPSWPYTYPDDMTMETVIDELGLVGTMTEITVEKSPYTIDGMGFLTENKWTVLRTNWHRLPEVTLSRNLGILIEVEYATEGISANQALTFLTYPSLTTRYGYVKNYMSHHLTYGSLPLVFTSNDSINAQIDRPLSRLTDVLLHMSEIADEFISNWTYYDILSGYSADNPETQSKLVNPELAPLPNLIWLSQFVGARRDAVKPTSTAWSGLPSTWTRIEDLVDTTDPESLGVVTWTELETYSPSFSKLTEYLQFAISNGYVGFRAGSEEAIVETVKFFLDNNKVAWINKNPVGTNRFSVTLYTYIGDTPDATGVGGTSETVRAAIDISKPVGIEVVHEILADL
jgi:hypothetical protein